MLVWLIKYSKKQNIGQRLITLGYSPTLIKHSKHFRSCMLNPKLSNIRPQKFKEKLASWNTRQIFPQKHVTNGGRTARPSQESPLEQTNCSYLTRKTIIPWGYARASTNIYLCAYTLFLQNQSKIPKSIAETKKQYLNPFAWRLTQNKL